jgi:aspartyl-tRNA synthetase
MAKSNKETGDRIAGELVAQTMEWFEGDIAKETVNECVKFSQKLIRSLMGADLTEVKAKDQSQMLAYIGKTLDQVARLVQFGEGKPDSRQEVTLASLLPLLTEDEMAIFDKALARIEATGASEKSELH